MEWNDLTEFVFTRGRRITLHIRAPCWSVNGTLLATGTYTEGQAAAATIELLDANRDCSQYHVHRLDAQWRPILYQSDYQFQSAGIDNAPLHALKDSVDGANAVYVYGSGGVLPNLGYLSSNYWVDVDSYPPPALLHSPLSRFRERRRA